VIDSCHGLGLGHGSRGMRATGQLTDGSRGSRVTNCDPLSALTRRLMLMKVKYAMHVYARLAHLAHQNTPKHAVYK